MITMSSPRIARTALSLALVVGASACAGTQGPSYPIPDEPGLYAFTTEDDVMRLDGDPDWEVETWPERSSMPSNVHFVINEPAIAGRSAGSAVELWRVAWVRSEIDAQGQAMPVAGSEWAVAPIESFAIPFRYESPPGQTEIVHIVPTAALQPGLYTLRIPGVRQARVGVNWDSVDQRHYSAANCVDLYEGNVYRACTVAVGSPIAALPAPADPYAAGVTANASDGGLGSLTAPAPVPSTTARPVAAATTAAGLQIALIDPVRRNDGLIIHGVVINTTDQVLAIPVMQGSLETSTGQEVRRWQFQPPVASLQPGARANFTTEVRPIPANVARASVAFVAQ